MVEGKLRRAWIRRIQPRSRRSARLLSKGFSGSARRPSGRTEDCQLWQGAPGLHRADGRLLPAQSSRAFLGWPVVVQDEQSPGPDQTTRAQRQSGRRLTCGPLSGVHLLRALRRESCADDKWPVPRSVFKAYFRTGESGHADGNELRASFATGRAADPLVSPHVDCLASAGLDDPGRVFDTAMPFSTIVNSSNFGRFARSAHPAGHRVCAIEMAVSPVVIRPTFSSTCGAPSPARASSSQSVSAWDLPIPWRRFGLLAANPPVFRYLVNLFTGIFL